MRSVNIKTTKKCAFCKYWYDPTYSAIRPKSPKINLWELDESVRKMCLRKDHETEALSYCSYYSCKLEIL